MIRQVFPNCVCIWITPGHQHAEARADDDPGDLLAVGAGKMILYQLDVQINQINAQQAQELKNRQTKAENVIGLYIQSLYRFYKLYPRHADFDDIFNEKLDFHHLIMLKSYISDTETLLQIVEFYLRKGYFEDALTIYRRLIEEGTGDEVLYQKSGYCRQME